MRAGLEDADSLGEALGRGGRRGVHHHAEFLSRVEKILDALAPEVEHGDYLRAAAAENLHRERGLRDAVGHRSEFCREVREDRFGRSDLARGIADRDPEPRISVHRSRRRRRSRESGLAHPLERFCERLLIDADLLRHEPEAGERLDGHTCGL